METAALCCVHGPSEKLGSHSAQLKHTFYLSLTPFSLLSSALLPFLLLRMFLCFCLSPPPSFSTKVKFFSKFLLLKRLTCSFLFGAEGGVVPLLPDSPPLSGLGSSEWGGAPHLAPETRVLSLHLDLRGQHAGQCKPSGSVL